MAVKEVKCKLCDTWVPVNDLKKHIKTMHGTETITPESVFGVR